MNLRTRVMKVIKKGLPLCTPWPSTHPKHRLFLYLMTRYKNLFDLKKKELQMKMSSVMPFSFNAVEICVVIINEKPWTRAREVWRTLEYDAKTSKTANIIKAHCSPETITQKYHMSKVHAACTPIKWPKDSQKYDIYINEEGMHEIVFSSQQPKAKAFRNHCWNVLFPHVRQQLSDKSHAMEM